MEEKKRYISRGINFDLDANEGMDHRYNDRDKFFYRDNLFGIFDSVEMKSRLARTLGVDSKIIFGKKYMEWERELSDFNLELLTPYQLMQIQLSFAEPEDLNKIEMAIETLKQTYGKFLKQIEFFYKKINCSSEQPPLPKIENGKLVFDSGIYLLHNTIFTDVEDLESRHELGLLASEWFGRLESKGECRFCTSFSKCKNITPELIAKAFHEDGDSFGGAAEMAFIVDTSSPELQKLLHLDLYQFLRNERKGKLSGYSSDEIEFLRNLKAWNTDKESEKHELLKDLEGKASIVYKKNSDWSMIPGGIPAKYIVGIIARNINSKDEKQMEYIKAAGDIFGVPVVDKNLSVIYASRKAKLAK